MQYERQTGYLDIHFYLFFFFLKKKKLFLLLFEIFCLFFRV